MICTHWCPCSKQKTFCRSHVKTRRRRGQGDFPSYSAPQVPAPKFELRSPLCFPSLPTDHSGVAAVDIVNLGLVRLAVRDIVSIALVLFDQFAIFEFLNNGSSAPASLLDAFVEFGRKFHSDQRVVDVASEYPV